MLQTWRQVILDISNFTSTEKKWRYNVIETSIILFKIHFKVSRHARLKIWKKSTVKLVYHDLPEQHVKFVSDFWTPLDVYIEGIG